MLSNDFSLVERLEALLESRGVVKTTASRFFSREALLRAHLPRVRRRIACLLSYKWCAILSGEGFVSVVAMDGYFESIHPNLDASRFELCDAFFDYDSDGRAFRRFCQNCLNGHDRSLTFFFKGSKGPQQVLETYVSPTPVTWTSAGRKRIALCGVTVEVTLEKWSMATAMYFSSGETTAGSTTDSDTEDDDASLSSHSGSTW